MEGNFPKEQILMRTNRDCGVVVEANANGIPYEEAAKGFDDLNDDFRDDLNDSPLHHKFFLWKKGIPSRIVTDDDIVAGRCAPVRTCILIHDLRSPTLAQHWVNFLSTDPERVTLWMNLPNLPVKSYTHQDFKDLYRKGSFNHAHEVGVGSVRKPSWLERLYVWFTRIIG